MTATEVATRAYELLAKDDVDGVLALFPDDAMVIIPGETRISGTHQKADFKAILATLASAAKSGSHRQELICRYESRDGTMFVFDNFVKLDGREEQYHSVDEWMMRDGRLRAVMVYVHEYDVFAKAWA